MIKYFAHIFVLVAAAVASGCTMANVDPPPLSGPSEMSLSLAVTANPDILTLSAAGGSQTLVTVEARDVTGQLVPNVPLRVDILANGQSTDFGFLSAQTVVTGSDGRARFTYTAPPFISGTIPSLQLSVTPTGNDASAHLERLVTVRLVPPGGTIGGTPNALFTVTPSNPAAFTNVRFDGSTSTAALGAIVTSYVWDFGDGESGTGVIATHQYSTSGTFVARLTVTDSNGRSNTHPGVPITVGAGDGPTAQFLFSPEAPAACQQVFFNATQSTAGGNHRIVNYNWSWGDGTPNQGGSTRSHVFRREGNWVVVLTVTDEVGQKALTTQTVSAGPATTPCP